MSTKKRKSTATEKMGVNYLRTIVEGANCIFHEFHKENDFGNDAIIELVEHEEVKGICIAVPHRYLDNGDHAAGGTGG
jgi:hypothetical protein